MGQAANNNGRNASLDSKKTRAAGRGTRNTAADFDSPQAGRGKTLGAFGNDQRKGARASRKHGNAGSTDAK